MAKSTNIDTLLNNELKKIVSIEQNLSLIKSFEVMNKAEALGRIVQHAEIKIFYNGSNVNFPINFKTAESIYEALQAEQRINLESLESSKMKLAIVEKILNTANTIAGDATLKDIAVKLGVI